MPIPPDDFDVDFDFACDTPAGKDPDSHSPTLRTYHQLLWSKTTGTGHVLALEAPSNRSKGYLLHVGAERMVFGSDTITNSYGRWLRPKALAASITALSEEQRVRYLNQPYTIASSMVWPVRSKHRPTINQARGTRSVIADRMDLTLECVRRHFGGEEDHPLRNVLQSYGDFFAFFDGFADFVGFFHLQDLVTPDLERVNFWLPHDEFRRPGTPVSVDEYVTYREGTLDFIERRRARIREWISAQRDA